MTGGVDPSALYIVDGWLAALGLTYLLYGGRLLGGRHPVYDVAALGLLAFGLTAPHAEPAAPSVIRAAHAVAVFAAALAVGSLATETRPVGVPTDDR